MNRLNDKVILITGGTQSIGEAIARIFLQQNPKHLYISGSRSQQKGDLLAEQLGERVSYLQLDVSKEDAWISVMQTIEKNQGGLDILINNAGVEFPVNADETKQNPEDCSLHDWHRVHEVNLDGVFLACKHAIRLMKKNKCDSSIVNIGSRSALVGIPVSAAYSSSKAAVRNYTKTVAMYCAGKNYPIRCNCIHPAAIATKMWDKELGLDEHREKRMQKFAKNIPLKRMGQADEIAHAVLYFASEESSFTTGAELVIDGGIMSQSGASPEDSPIDI